MPLRLRCEYAAVFPRSLPGSHAHHLGSSPPEHPGRCAPPPAHIHQI